LLIVPYGRDDHIFKAYYNLKVYSPTAGIDMETNKTSGEKKDSMFNYPPGILVILVIFSSRLPFERFISRLLLLYDGR